MADNYLEKKYDEFLNKKSGMKKVGQSLDTLLKKNRSCRGYDQDFEVTMPMLERIVGVNTKISSARNQQVLRFKIVGKGEEADFIQKNIKMGGALPELHLPLQGTAPEAFIIICCTIPETKYVDIDLGISVQSMTLKATEMGLSGICICAFGKEEIKNRLHLPYEPLAIVALGKGIEKIELTPITENESHAYYRKNGIHFVPKVKLDDLIIK